MAQVKEIASPEGFQIAYASFTVRFCAFIIDFVVASGLLATLFLLLLEFVDLDVADSFFTPFPIPPPDCLTNQKMRQWFAEHVHHESPIKLLQDL